MTAKEQEIWELLENEISLRELREKTELNNYQLSLRLKSLRNKGYLIKNIFYEEELKYTKGKRIISEENPIKIIPTSRDFRFLVISDTHFGAIFDNMEMLDRIYEYAIKNSIHTIIHLGDLIEGTRYQDKLKLYSTKEQLEYVIKNYPKDESIRNYQLFGNHELYSIRLDGYDIAKTLFERRLDFTFLGYQKRELQLYDSRVLLFHKFNKDIPENITKNTRLILRGHYHNSQIQKTGKVLCINAPNLSNDNRDGVGLPGAFDITILNSFEETLLCPLVIEPRAEKVTEVLVKTK